MAASSRPKSFADARTAYSSNTELVWWVFMRISGLLLVFLVFGHLFFNNIQINVANVDYQYVADRFSKSWVRVYDSFLLGFALLHGTNGLRYVIEDTARRPGPRFWWKAGLFTVSAVLFVLGVMTLWVFDYSQMGDAIRAVSHGG